MSRNRKARSTPLRGWDGRRPNLQLAPEVKEARDQAVLEAVHQGAETVRQVSERTNLGDTPARQSLARLARNKRVRRYTAMFGDQRYAPLV